MIEPFLLVTTRTQEAKERRNIRIREVEERKSKHHHDHRLIGGIQSFNSTNETWCVTLSRYITE